VERWEVGAEYEGVGWGWVGVDAGVKLGKIEQHRRAVGYDEERHRALRTRAAELAGAERERELLEQACLASEHLSSQIADLTGSVQRLDSESTAERARRDKLCAETSGLPSEREQLADLDTELGEAKRQRDEIRDQCLFAQSRLDNCAFLERKQKESLARQDAFRPGQRIFGDLVHAFGRRGVQAMIIETAIPEIEAEANRILARMTDGRMHVKFETQRDSRSGSGVIETLDIKIADELGTRSYELFSGG